MNTIQDKKRITKSEKDSPAENDLLTRSEQLMPELRTLTYCLLKSVERGFTANYNVFEKRLQSGEGSKSYAPQEIKITNFYRFEGITDPADMAILYTIETNDGSRGTLIDAYGTYSNSEIDDFIKEVYHIEKQCRHSREMNDEQD